MKKFFLGTCMVAILFLLAGCVDTPTSYEQSKNDGSVKYEYGLKQLEMKDGFSAKITMVLATGTGSAKDTQSYIFYVEETPGNYRFVKANAVQVLIVESNEAKAECHREVAGDGASGCFVYDADAIGQYDDYYWVLKVPQGSVKTEINPNLDQLEAK